MIGKMTDAATDSALQAMFPSRVNPADRFLGTDDYLATLEFDPEGKRLSTEHRDELARLIIGFKSSMSCFAMDAHATAMACAQQRVDRDEYRIVGVGEASPRACLDPRLA